MKGLDIFWRGLRGVQHLLCCLRLIHCEIFMKYVLSLEFFIPSKLYFNENKDSTKIDSNIKLPHLMNGYI
jgi:hypothetical protein